MATFDQIIAAINEARRRTGADNLYYVCGDKPFIALLIQGFDDGKPVNTFDKLHHPKNSDEAIEFLKAWAPQE